MENMEDMLNMEDQSRFLYTGGEVNINLLPAFSVYLLGVAGVALNMQSGSETEMRNEQIDDDVLSNVRPPFLSLIFTCRLCRVGLPVGQH